jgi:hypothetical protein
MSFTPREVLIPLVGSAAGGALCRVAADGYLPPHHPAHLDRAISDLLESGLYQAGQQARAAVRRLKVNGGWFHRPAPVALSIVNPGDVAGLAPDNSTSAELGLALAMLMYVTQSPSGTVIASGALEANSADADGPIRAVHHLRAKFAVLEKYFRQSGVSSPPAVFFTPEMDVDGVPIADKHADSVQALRALGIEVVPVSSLRAAAARLKALRLQQRPHEVWLRRGGIAGLVLLAVAAGKVSVSVSGALLSRVPIPMEFLASALGDGRIVQTPARFHRKSDNISYPALPCRTATGLPLYRVGDTLAAKIRSGSPDDWVGMFGPNYHVLVAIAPTGGTGADSKPVIKVLPFATPWDGPVRPGEKIEFSDDVQEADELVVVLAQRFEPFDRDRLAAELHQRLDPLQPSERVNAATNFLRRSAPGWLEYVFRTTSKGEDCPDE